MGHLRKFLHLGAARRRLLVEAVLLSAAIALALRLLRFQALRRIAGRLTRGPARPTGANQAYIDSVVWAVSVSGRHVPGAGGCLVQALAGMVLLGRGGCPALMHIGVDKDAQGRFQAHAWVECRGAVVLGGTENPSHFAPLAALDMP
jgi:hypothetical protein